VLDDLAGWADVLIESFSPRGRAALGLDYARLSARNQLAGRVTRLTVGAVNSEVILALPGGGSIAVIVTQASAQALGLVVGVDAVAVFKASSVIVGVAA